MSIDGPGVFEDDTAHDVRSTYRHALEDGATDEAARDTVLGEFAYCLDDQADAALGEDPTVVWIALAMAQYELGRLDADVRDRALAALEPSLRSWEHDPALHRRRKRVLATVRSKLEGDPPARKRVTRPRSLATDLTAGDVLAFTAASGRRFLLEVVALKPGRGGALPVVRLLDWQQRHLPAPDVLGQLPVRRQGRRYTSEGSAPEPWHVTEGTVGHTARWGWREAGFELVGRRPLISDEMRELWEHNGGGSFSYWDFWSGYLTRQDELISDEPDPTPPATPKNRLRRIVGRR